MTEASLDEVRGAFDRIAGTIDQLVVRNPINAWMRQVSLRRIRDSFSAGSCLLDLGCGTCEDAIQLANKGCRVFALDISGEMVEVARKKILSLGLQDRIIVARGRIADLAGALEPCPWKRFDGAYANFSLTYENSLEKIAGALSVVLGPGAQVFCTLPNRTVLSELVLYGVRLRFRGFLWRFHDPLLFDVHGTRLRIRAYSPWQVRRAFAPFFGLEYAIGVPVFLPPVYLREWYDRLGGARELLKHLDILLAGRYPWNRLGEHTLFKFRRRNTHGS